MFLQNKKAQVMIEFAFSIVVLFVMLYGLTHIFQWSGVNPVQRYQAHESLFSPGRISPVDTRPSGINDSGVIKQLEPNFYTHVGMDAILKDAL